MDTRVLQEAEESKLPNEFAGDGRAEDVERQLDGRRRRADDAKPFGSVNQFLEFGYTF